MISFVGAFIAAAVAVITFLQWQTAREKVLLDLFDKRFTVYEELRSVVREYVASPKVRSESVDAFTKAASRAQFLFGPEVQGFLEVRRVDLNWEMVTRNRQPVEMPETQRARQEAALVAGTERLSAFFNDFDKLVAPYMEHHQKALRSRSDWIDWLRQIAA